MDAGSTDHTREIISEHIARGLPARLLVEPGANRARGRNLAIREATGDVIASIDAGCVAEPDWLARLVAPFESGDPPHVVSGYYRPEATSLRQQAIAAATVPDVSEVDPQTFYTVDRFSEANHLTPLPQMPLPHATGWRAILKKK